MKTLGLLIGILSAIGMLIAFIPFFGWLNWLVIPFAIIGLICSSTGESSGGKTLCGIAIIAGILRLMLGGGLL